MRNDGAERDRSRPAHVGNDEPRGDRDRGDREGDREERQVDDGREVVAQVAR